MKVYSVKEAAKIIGIKPRAVQFRCKRDDVRKKDNKYLITDLLINSWIDKKKPQKEQRKICDDRK